MNQETSLEIPEIALAHSLIDQAKEALAAGKEVEIPVYLERFDLAFPLVPRFSVNGLSSNSGLGALIDDVLELDAKKNAEYRSGLNSMETPTYSQSIIASKTPGIFSLWEVATVGTTRTLAHRGSLLVSPERDIANPKDPQAWSFFFTNVIQAQNSKTTS